MVRTPHRAVQVVPVGVDRAICEIITPVVERSVTIACMTTNELILKDFAFEPDDVRLLNVRSRPLTAASDRLRCRDPSTLLC
jgi:CCR4-NOT transcription complex subunit 1